MVDGSYQGLHRVLRTSDASGSDGDATRGHCQRVVARILVQATLDVDLDDSRLPCRVVDATAAQCLDQVFFHLSAFLVPRFPPLPALHGHYAGDARVAVVDFDLLGCGENVVVVARVGVANGVDAFVVGPHIVAIGIGHAITPLSGRVEWAIGHVDGHGVRQVTVHHHMRSLRTVTVVDHGAAHEQVYHKRIAGGQRMVARVGCDAVIGGRHLLHIHGRTVGQPHRARELVEKQLPVTVEHLVRSVGNHQARAVPPRLGVVRSHVPAHCHRALCHGKQGTACHQHHERSYSFHHRDIVLKLQN